MANQRPIMRFNKPEARGPGWEPPTKDAQPSRWDAPVARGERVQRVQSSRTASVNGQPPAEIKHHARRKRFAREVMHDILAGVGEFAGTYMFLLLSFLGAASAGFNRGGASNTGTGGDTSVTTNDNQTILFIALSFGMSLIVTAWAFFRITGSAFNPAVTLALWLVGNISARRAVGITIAQLVGGIAAAGTAKGLTLGTFGVVNTLSAGVSTGQGLGIELFTTALLVFTVQMTAIEKSRTTYLAPVAIGLSVFVGHLASIGWTGAGMNPARSLGPSVVTGTFPKNAWLYYVGQYLGAILSTMLYALLKHLDYEEVVGGIDTDDNEASAQGIHRAPVTALINAVPGMQAGGALADPEVQEQVAAEKRAEAELLADEAEELQRQSTLTSEERAAQKV